MDNRFCIFIAAIVVYFVASACTTGNGPVYLIRTESGDTLARIAEKYDTTWQSIAAMNGVSEPSSLPVGVVLRLRPGPASQVKIGDGSSMGPTGLPVQPALSDRAFERETGGAGRGLLFGGADLGLSWPLRGRITSRYGPRWGRIHHGIDIKGRRGAKVRATYPGQVTFVGRKSGYGKTVVIRHKTFKSLYAHFNKILVNHGDWVGQGTAIGTVGTTGNSTGPHLHFEIRDGRGKSVDPLLLLRSDELISSI